MRTRPGTTDQPTHRSFGSRRRERRGVVILGGGFAAVEMALALRMADGSHERPITVVSHRRTLSAGADLVSAPLGDDPRIAQVAAERFRSVSD